MKSKFTLHNHPFTHISKAGIAKLDDINRVYDWFEYTDLWEYTETDFYTQYEFSVLHASLPECCKWLTEANTIKGLEKELTTVFNEKDLKLTAITAHKLTNGYRMGVHNDFLGGEETHRLVIQINQNWTEANGGFLMLFNSDVAQDVAKVIQPLNNSAIGFEISDRSFHAVSTVHHFTRYTIVYTFKRNTDAA